MTGKENEILLKIFKDLNKEYNANSISKEIKITPRGALKILKNLEAKGLIKGREMGKAKFYRINLKDDYTCKIIETLLISEARNKVARWLEEFKGIFKESKIIIIFGSIIRNPRDANDIDILFVFDKEKYKNIKVFVDEKNRILIKKIHYVPMTTEDLNKNLKNNSAIRDAVKTGYVLHGYDNLIEVMKNVSSE